MDSPAYVSVQARSCAIPCTCRWNRVFRSRLVRAMETYSQVYLIGGVAVLLLLFFGELCRGLSPN